MTTRGRGPVLIMAGGTGGHVYPALAVAEELRARSTAVVWLGTRRGIESRVVPAAGFPVEWVSIGGIRGKSALTLLLAPFKLLVALSQSLRAMHRHRPSVVLGMGGFASGPGGVAAWLSRRPLVIHEQNAIAGLTNRLLARLARVVLQAFPGSFSPRVRARTVGNPVRREIAALPPPAERIRAGERCRLLVLGGSLGALALNRTVPAALGRLDAATRPEVRHQAGTRTLRDARDAYRAAGVDADVVEFIDDMAAAYAWADLVVCRAGAMTVSEVSAAGLPAVFVPFPHAVDDHQAANARGLVAAGAAALVREAELSAETLADLLRTWTLDRPGLEKRAARAREQARPEALEDITACCLKLAGARA